LQKAFISDLTTGLFGLKNHFLPTHLTQERRKTMVDYKDDLGLLDDEHDPSKVTWSEKVPDETYQARLDSARILRARTSGRLQTVFEFEILHGEHQGRTITKFAGMETEKNLDFLTRDIWKLMGEQIDFKWKDVEKIYEKILDVIAEVRCQTDKNSGIQNVWIQKRIKKTEADLKAEKHNTSNNDVPF